MKAITIGFAVGLGLMTVRASAQADLCKDVMPCGTYQGNGGWYDAQGRLLKGGTYQERIIITQVNKTTLNVEVDFADPGGPFQKSWMDANLDFQPDGQFTIVDKEGVAHAAGSCANKVCTVAFQPVAVTSDKTPFTNAFVDILRFENGQLKRYNMVSNNSSDAQLKFQRSDLTLRHAGDL